MLEIDLVMHSSMHTAVLKLIYKDSTVHYSTSTSINNISKLLQCDKRYV